DWKFFKHYDDFVEVSEHALRRTSTGEAPWHIIEATDPRHRALAVVKTVADAITGRLQEAAPAAPKKPAKVTQLHKSGDPTLLSALDLNLTVDKEKYENKLPKLQGKLNKLVRKLADKERSLVMVFEGPDAAGKGGTIRRVSQAMDAGAYDVTSI